jgi:hypothetical protein
VEHRAVLGEVDRPPANIASRNAATSARSASATSSGSVSGRMRFFE